MIGLHYSKPAYEMVIREMVMVKANQDQDKDNQDQDKQEPPRALTHLQLI
jgi:hypothetical protein